MTFFLGPGVIESLPFNRPQWRSGALAPLAEVIALGERARTWSQAVQGLGLDDIGVAFAARVIATLKGRRRNRERTGAGNRRRAMESALWIEQHSAEDMSLESLARRVDLSMFHYLRVFTAVLGVTPHQHLLRSRLRCAARLLTDCERSITNIALESGFADLSNYVRTFRRMAGVSPRDYRRAAHGDRKIFQERIDANP